MELFQPTKISLVTFFGPPCIGKKASNLHQLEAGGGLKGITASGAELPEPAAGLLGPLVREGGKVGRSFGRGPTTTSPWGQQ